MQRPLAVLTFFFCLGIFVSSQISSSFLLAYALAVIFFSASLFSFKKGLVFNIFLFCLVFLLGSAVLKNSGTLPRCHIFNYVSYQHNQPYMIRGFIANEPQVKFRRTAFIFKAQEIQTANLHHRCCGDILVYAKSTKGLSYGEELILKGNLSKYIGLQQSYRNYLHNQGIFLVMRIKNAADIVRLNKNKGFVLEIFALWLKKKMEGIISKYIPSPAAGVLEAMILGERKNVGGFINNAMIKSGTVHILVVSGFNTGLVALIIILILKLLRFSKKARFYIAVPLLLLYCLLTGASNPVVRATIMTILYLFAYFVKSEPDIYQSFAIAALVILGINPRQLFDVGFQLSFMSVFSIVFLYPRLKSFLGLNFLKNKSLRFIADNFLVSFSAWIGTCAFVAYYFKIFSPVTVLANMLIVPLATLITLCGFSLIIFAFLFPPLAPFFASSSTLAVALLLHINSFLISIPAAYFYLT